MSCRVLDDFRRVQEGLGRDAAHVEAHPAEHGPALDERDLESQIRGAERRGVAAGTRAEHDEIERTGGSGGSGRSFGGPQPDGAGGAAQGLRAGSPAAGAGAAAAGGALVPRAFRRALSSVAGFRPPSRRRLALSITVAMTVPVTSWPFLTAIDATTCRPPDEGTSMDAFSLSSVMSGSSTRISAPDGHQHFDRR
jgi:hypothetical protein